MASSAQRLLAEPTRCTCRFFRWDYSLHQGLGYVTDPASIASSRVLEGSHSFQNVTATLHMQATACRDLRHVHVADTDFPVPLSSLARAVPMLCMACFMAHLVEACYESHQSLEAACNSVAAAQHSSAQYKRLLFTPRAFTVPSQCHTQRQPTKHGEQVSPEQWTPSGIDRCVQLAGI
jgi:hypothetical protein